MKIRFWGTRGSVSVSDASTLRYGGHTSCMEIRSSANDLLVLDAGTGLRGLGQSLLREDKLPRTSNLLISHTHWDHIQGLPFFAPFYLPQHKWGVYGPSTLSQDLESILSGQMKQTYFPITPESFNADLTYNTLREESFELGEIKVTTRYLNHPGVTLGYRIEVDGYTIVYSTDHEPHDCRLAHGGTPAEGSEDALHGDFLAQADFVIHDTQYLSEEYESKRGWGHSTMEYVVDLAQRADVKRLIFFHHDPQRSDTEIDQMVEQGRVRLLPKVGRTELSAASESLPILSPKKSLELGSTKSTIRMGQSSTPLYKPVPKLERQFTPIPLATQKVIIRTSQAVEISQVVLDAGHHPVMVKGLQDFERELKQTQCALLMLDFPGYDDLKTYYRMLKRAFTDQPLPKVVLLCQNDEALTTEQLNTLDPLPIRVVVPVSNIYISSRIQTWLERSVQEKNPLEWTPASRVDHDAARSAMAEELLQIYRHSSADELPLKAQVRGILEITYQLLASPSKQDLTVACNLITAKREESLMAIPALKTWNVVREESMCDHVVAKSERIIIADVLQHELFRHHAKYTQAESTDRVRSYFGFPLIVSGHTLGTLCCFSVNQMQLFPNQLRGATRAAELLSELMSSTLS